MALRALDAKNFDKAINGERPAFVDFWAQWCGPCRQFLPTVEDASAEMGEKYDFFKVNVDEEPDLPERFGITGIPTAMIFKKGKAIARHSGSMSKRDLLEFLNQHL